MSGCEQKEPKGNKGRPFIMTKVSIFTWLTIKEDKVILGIWIFRKEGKCVVGRTRVPSYNKWVNGLGHG